MSAKRSPRILIANDNEEVLELVRVLLGRAGYEMFIACDGRTALRGMFTRRPDLVVLDLDIPVLDGWKVLESIRHLSDVPVIVLGDDQSELDRVRALRGGADEWLAKPCHGETLLERIDAQLAKAVDRDADDEDDGITVVDLLPRR